MYATETRRNAGYISSSVDSSPGHPKQGPHAGLKSHAIGAPSGHPREGSTAGYRSHTEVSVSRVHTVFEGPFSRRASQETPIPEFDKVSDPTFIALSIGTAVLPGITFTSAAVVGYEFPSNPLLGAAEATALAAGATLSFLVSKKFMRSEL